MEPPRHPQIAAQLEAASDDDLLRLLTDPQLLDHGHAPLRLPRSGAHVFVKLLPLSDLEITPAHRDSTSNFFGLPAYYQYRIGSCGFGAWRELEVHRLANEWITSGRCTSFSFLHHWRILPIVRSGEDDRTSLDHWGDDPAIRRRVSSITNATSSVVLFLEYVPSTLGRWLDEQLSGHRDPVALVTGIEHRLTQLLAFIRGQGLLHMDAHFGNVLTDGDHLYLCDYGLALSRDFELGSDELRFFERHQSFDECVAFTSLVHAVVTHYGAPDDWRQSLRELPDDMPAPMRAYVSARAPVALAMGEFYRRLLDDLETPYPAARLEQLLTSLTASNGLGIGTK